MLCLLTYAYATGVLGSEEIVRHSAEDELLRSICGQHPLTAMAIKRFRRENRGLLKWALVQVFKRAFTTHFSVEHFALPAGVRRSLDHAATLRLNLARQMDRSEEP